MEEEGNLPAVTQLRWYIGACRGAFLNSLRAPSGSKARLIVLVVRLALEDRLSSFLELLLRRAASSKSAKAPKNKVRVVEMSEFSSDSASNGLKKAISVGILLLLAPSNISVRASPRIGGTAFAKQQLGLI